MNVISATDGRLQALAKRLRATMNASASGPLMVAGEVVEIAANWDNFRSEADGKDCTTWLRSEVGPGCGLPFFEARHRATVALGRQNAQRLHHEAAVWLVGNVPEQYRLPVMSDCHKLYRDPKRNNGACVTRAQMKRIADKVMERVPQHRVCERCKRLEEQVRQMGGEPVE